MNQSITPSRLTGSTYVDPPRIEGDTFAPPGSIRIQQSAEKGPQRAGGYATSLKSHHPGNLDTPVYEANFTVLGGDNESVTLGRGETRKTFVLNISNQPLLKTEPNAGLLSVADVEGARGTVLLSGPPRSDADLLRAGEHVDMSDKFKTPVAKDTSVLGPRGTAPPPPPPAPSESLLGKADTDKLLKAGIPAPDPTHAPPSRLPPPTHAPPSRPPPPPPAPSEGLLGEADIDKLLKAVILPPRPPPPATAGGSEVKLKSILKHPDRGVEHYKSVEQGVVNYWIDRQNPNDRLTVVWEKVGKVDETTPEYDRDTPC